MVIRGSSASRSNIFLDGANVAVFIDEIDTDVLTSLLLHRLDGRLLFLVDNTLEGSCLTTDDNLNATKCLVTTTECTSLTWSCSRVLDIRRDDNLSAVSCSCQGRHSSLGRDVSCGNLVQYTSGTVTALDDNFLNLPETLFAVSNLKVCKMCTCWASTI